VLFLIVATHCCHIFDYVSAADVRDAFQKQDDIDSSGLLDLMRVIITVTSCCSC
jgi:hypothetical protein